MFGILDRVKSEKVNLSEVAEVLSRRFWDYEMVPGKSDTIVVLSKYYNNKRVFHKLYLKFIGGNVEFRDQRGSFISQVSKGRMFPEMMDILNVVS